MKIRHVQRMNALLEAGFSKEEIEPSGFDLYGIENCLFEVDEGLYAVLTEKEAELAGLEALTEQLEMINSEGVPLKHKIQKLKSFAGDIEPENCHRQLLSGNFYKKTEVDEIELHIFRVD